MQAASPPPWKALVLDMNGDGQFTIGDAGPWLVHMFFLPGDSLLWLMVTYAPSMVRFFELSDSAFGGVESAGLSTGGWIIALLVFGNVHSMLVRIKCTVTSFLDGVFREISRRIRVARLLLSYRLRRLTQRTEPTITETPQEVNLDDRDLQVLNVLSHHDEKDSYSGLGIREIAQRLGVSSQEAQRTIDKLKKLTLLVNRMDAHGSYQLTRPGEMFLLSRNMQSTA